MTRLPLSLHLKKKVSSLQFSPDGKSFIGIENNSRRAAIWHCNDFSVYPHKVLRSQTKEVNGACFLNSSSLVATCGACSSGRSLCVWDTLLPASSSLASSCSIPNLGGTALSFSSNYNMLFIGSSDGSIALFDMRQRKVRYSMSCDLVFFKGDRAYVIEMKNRLTRAGSCT
jgi:WD40 repeat protein